MNVFLLCICVPVFKMHVPMHTARNITLIPVHLHFFPFVFWLANGRKGVGGLVAGNLHNCTVQKS